MRLAPRSWDDSRSALASHLTQKTWDEVEQLVADLRAVDQRRTHGENLDNGLRGTLEELKPRLARSRDAPGPVDSLEDALVGARRLPVAVGWLIGAAVIGLVVAVIVALISSTSTWTSESVADVVRTIPPRAQSAICDSNTQIKGGYTCTVTLPRCARLTKPGKSATKCSPLTQLTYSVETEKSCYSAALTREVMNGDPPSFVEWLRRFAVRSGCKKG